MNSEASNQVGRIVNLVLTLFAIVAGWFLFVPNVISPRPAHKAGVGTYSLGDQKVESRLWADPLHRLHRVEEHLHPHCRSTDENGKLNLFSETKGAINELLIVPVQGAPYAEDVENRTRIRYAVVSALLKEGYVPGDPEHLGEVQIGWLDHQMKPDDTSWIRDPRFAGWSIFPKDPPTHEDSRICFRYERFVKRSGVCGHESARNILVIWVDEMALGTMSQLRYPLFAVRLCDMDTNVVASIRLLGPRSSGTLKELINPCEEHANTSDYADWAKKIELISPKASVPSFMLVGGETNFNNLVNSDGKGANADPVSGILSKKFRRFTSLAATEHQLARELFKELRNRGVALGTNAPSRVVLLTESDTYYGRSIKAIYQNALLEIYDGVVRTNLEYKPELTAQLEVYSYFRGTDGALIGDDLPKNSETNARNQVKNTDPERSMSAFLKLDGNQAEGHHQFDYLELVPKVRIFAMSNGEW